MIIVHYTVEILQVCDSALTDGQYSEYSYSTLNNGMALAKSNFK